jgi:hypothetical protein
MLPLRIINEKLKLKRVKSDPNLIGKDKHDLLDKYAELENKYFDELHKSFAIDHTKRQKTCFPFLNGQFTKKVSNKIENVSQEVSSANLDKKIEENVGSNSNTKTNELEIVSNENNQNNSVETSEKVKTNLTNSSKTAIRPSSKLKAGNFKETYIFFKTPLKKLKMSKTPTKEKNIFKQLHFKAQV